MLVGNLRNELAMIKNPTQKHFFHANFSIICSSSVKNAIGILIRLALNL